MAGVRAQRTGGDSSNVSGSETSGPPRRTGLLLGGRRLAFQDILENTLAGVLLLFRQPFRSGDQIEVKEQSGTVEAITIRETQIRTFDGQLVLVPSRDVYKSVIRVQTHHELRRLEFVVGVAYKNDPTDAINLIVAALHGASGVADDPRRPSSPSSAPRR